MDNLTNELRALVLIQALPYIKQYNDKIVVVKYGGNAMTNEDLKNSVMQDLVLLSTIGIKVVVVHGGGPKISNTLKELGKETNFVNGLRVTDEKTMEVAQMVLAGDINKNLVKMIGNKGGKAIGLSGIDAMMLKAEPISSELGFVGNITEVNPQIIIDTLNLGYIPVISTIACDELGNSYNINADTAAAKIAGALKAESFISMTDIKGVLSDNDDDSSLIHKINVSELGQLQRQGIIDGGMIPKVECCVEAIRRGVKKVFIIDGRVPHSLLIEMFSDEGIGTMFR